MADEKKNPRDGKDPGKGDDQGKQGNSGLYISSALFDIAAIPGYGTRLGKSEPGMRTFGQGSELIDRPTVTPGLAAVTWVPTYGVSLNKNSYLNRAADRFLAHMQNVLHQKTLPYQAADVMIVFAALESIHLWWKLGIRGLKAVKTNNDLNAYFRKQFTEACGWDYDDIMRNRITLFNYMDLVKSDIDVLHLPKTLPIWEAHFKMMDNVYADSASDKAQLYVCTPAAVWSYEVVDTLKGLTAVEVPTKLTVSKWIQIMDTLLLAVKNSTDFAKMEGDIKTVCEADGFYECDVPDLDSTLTVLHDPGFLTSLCNATVWDFDLTSLRIEDSRDNYLHCQPVAWVDTAFGNVEMIPPHRFNTITDKPTAQEMVNYSRWHVDLGARVAVRKYNVKSLGTEVITSFRIISDPNGTYDFLQVVDTSDGVANDFVANDFTYAPGRNLHASQNNALMYPIPLIVATSAFKWHPILWLAAYLGEEPDPEYVTVFPVTQWNFGFVYESSDLETAHELLLLHGLTPKT